MGREYEFELLLRNVLNCDRQERLLTVGGIATAGCLQVDGGFYIGVIAAVGSLYSKATINLCDELDLLVDKVQRYKTSRIDEIEEYEFEEIVNKIERINSLLN